MVDEIKNVNSVSAAQISGAEYSVGKTDLKKILIFEEFKKYAEAHGIELTPENLQAIEASMQAEVSALSLLGIFEKILDLKKTEPTEIPAEAGMLPETPVDNDLQNFFMAASSVLTEEPVTGEVSTVVTDELAGEFVTDVTDEVVVEPETVEEGTVTEPEAEVVEQEIEEQPEVTEPVGEEVVQEEVQPEQGAAVQETEVTEQVQEQPQVVEQTGVTTPQPEDVLQEPEAAVPQDAGNQAEVQPGTVTEPEGGQTEKVPKGPGAKYGIDTQTTENEGGIDGQEYVDNNEFELVTKEELLQDNTPENLNKAIAELYAKNEYITQVSDNKDSKLLAQEWDSLSDDDPIKKEAIDKWSKITSQRSADYNLMLINAANWWNDNITAIEEYDDNQKSALISSSIMEMKKYKEGFQIDSGMEEFLSISNLKFEVLKQTCIDLGVNENDILKILPSDGEGGIALEHVNQDAEKDLKKLIEDNWKDKDKKFDLDAAIKDYVSNGKNDKKLNEIFSGDKEKVENLKTSLSAGITISRVGQPSLLEKEGIGVKDVVSRYENGSDKDYEKYCDYIADLYETGHINAANELYKALDSLPEEIADKIRDELIKRGYMKGGSNITLGNNINADTMGKYAPQAGQQLFESDELSKEQKNSAYKVGLSKVKDKYVDGYFEVGCNNKDLLTVETRHFAIDNVQSRNLTEEQHERNAANINKLDDEDIAYSVYRARELDNAMAQSIYFNRGVEGSTYAAEQAVNWVKDLLAENQESGYNAIYQVAVNTGNKEMLDALCGQYSQLSPQAQQAIASNPQIVESMHAAAAEDAVNNKALLVELEHNQTNAFWGSESEKERFFNWENLTPAQKYERMCQIFKARFYKASKALRKIMFSYAKRDPFFLKDLVKSIGVSILDCAELSLDVRSMAARVLMNDPAHREEVAKKVVDAGYGAYDDSLIKYCADYLADNNQNIKNVQGFKNLSTRRKTEVLKAAESFSGTDSESDDFATSISFVRGSTRNNIPIYTNDFFKKKSNLSEFERWC